MGSQDENNLGSCAPCGACKYFRRRCTEDCEHAHYFPPDNLQKFSNILELFGETRMAKLLNELDADWRQYFIYHADRTLALRQMLRLVQQGLECVEKAIFDMLMHNVHTVNQGQHALLQLLMHVQRTTKRAEKTMSRTLSDLEHMQNDIIAKLHSLNRQELMQQQQNVDLAYQMMYHREQSSALLVHRMSHHREQSSAAVASASTEEEENLRVGVKNEERTRSQDENNLGSYAPCGACNYFRRRCTEDCGYASYFPPDNVQKFSNILEVLGETRMAKLLNELSANWRQYVIDRADRAFTLRQLLRQVEQALECGEKTQVDIFMLRGLNVNQRQQALRQLLMHVQRTVECVEKAMLHTLNHLVYMQNEIIAMLNHMLQQHNVGMFVYRMMPDHEQSSAASMVGKKT